MNGFNRLFLVLLALLWIAGWAVALYLMWEPGRELSVDNDTFQFLFDVSVSGTERAIGTIVAVVAIVLALLFLFAQVSTARQRAPERDRAGAYDIERDERYRDLHRRLDELQSRVDSGDTRMRDRPVAPDQP